ncbi:trypsin-like peptidase domain-containing protein [Candidatus Poribacteria bacterium]|nr:trypsin-like peptidase domain-containing protein [Candidatus Poribacteria bacterium]
MLKNISSYCILFFLFISFCSCSSRSEQTSNLELLGAIEKAFVDIAEKSKPAIVGVLARNISKEQAKQGSGFFFKKDGYILTNNHNIIDAEQIKVKLLNGKSLDAKLIGGDVITDIAILKVSGKEQFPTLQLADSDKVKVGQFAIAIGNPFNLEYTVTTGIVSGKSRLILGGLRVVRHQNFIQTDTWIHSGSSGGPLLNIHGEVIGINSLIQKSENTPAPVRAGAGFAIPSNLVRTIGNELIANGKIIHGYLGIAMQEASEGILITRIGPDTPADHGGLKRFDIILEYNGKKVNTSPELQMLVAQSQVGKESIIKVLRMTEKRTMQERTLKVTIGEMPREMAGLPIEDNSISWKMLGLSVRKLDKQDFQRYTYLSDKDRGVIVESVKENAPGFKARIPGGALIYAINGKQIYDVQALEALLQTLQDATELIIDIKSNYGEEKLTIKLDKKSP